MVSLPRGFFLDDHSEGGFPVQLKPEASETPKVRRKFNFKFSLGRSFGVVHSLAVMTCRSHESDPARLSYFAPLPVNGGVTRSRVPIERVGVFTAT